MLKIRDFNLLEQSDIELVKSNKINEIHKNIGLVKYSSLASSKVSASFRPLPLTGQESTITICFDGSPVPVSPSLISCSLTPPDNSQPTLR